MMQHLPSKLPNRFLCIDVIGIASILYLNLSNKTLSNANKHVKLYKSQNRFTAAVKYAYGSSMNCICFHVKTKSQPWEWRKNFIPDQLWIKFILMIEICVHTVCCNAGMTAWLHDFNSGAKVFKHVNRSCRKCSIINFKCIWRAFPTSIYCILCWSLSLHVHMWTRLKTVLINRIVMHMCIVICIWA